MTKIAPRSDFQATQWGFTTRDFGITITGFLLGILQVITPYVSIFFRLVFFAVIVLSAVVIAFWRVDKVFTLEEYLLKRIRLQRGAREVFTKDGAAFDNLQQYHNPPISEKSAPKTNPSASGHVIGVLPGWLTPRSNQDLLFSALSVLSFVVFIAWIGTSGVADAQTLLGYYSQYIW
jgi:hypothetical protein